MHWRGPRQSRAPHPISEAKQALIFLQLGLILGPHSRVYNAWIQSSTLSLHLWGFGILPWLAGGAMLPVDCVGPAGLSILLTYTPIDTLWQSVLIGCKLWPSAWWWSQWAVATQTLPLVLIKKSRTWIASSHKPCDGILLHMSLGVPFPSRPHSSFSFPS